MPTKQWYAKNKAKSKSYNANWRLKNKEYFADYHRNYRKRPEQIKKDKARHKVRNKIALGKLLRQICSIADCGKLAEAHHTDYGKPLKIIWLCKEHHEKEHSVSA